MLASGGDDHEIDARPSDAIALAVRVAAPIFATEAVLDRASVIPEADEEERLSVFRDFVNSLGADGVAPAGKAAGRVGVGLQEQLADDAVSNGEPMTARPTPLARAATTPSRSPSATVHRVERPSLPAGQRSP